MILITERTFVVLDRILLMLNMMCCEFCVVFLNNYYCGAEVGKDFSDFG